MKDVIAQTVLESPGPAKKLSNHEQRKAAYALVVQYHRYLLQYTRRTCRRFNLPQSSFDDVCSCVTLAALEAAPHYDPTLASFPTFLRVYLWGAVCIYLAENGRAVYVPPAKIARLLRVSALVSKYREQNKSCSLAVLAEASGVTVREIESLSLLFPSQSLDSPTSQSDEGSETTFVDLLQSDDPSAYDCMVQEECRTVVHELICHLSPQHQRIIELHFFSDPPVPLRDIAKEFALSGERVRQIEVIILSRMIRLLKVRGIRPYAAVAGP